jgi:hypothetical protein
MTMSNELENLQMTAICLSSLCRLIIDSVDNNTVTPELIEFVLHDLEVGDCSLYSALTNCLEPVGY